MRVVTSDIDPSIPDDSGYTESVGERLELIASHIDDDPHWLPLGFSRPSPFLSAGGLVSSMAQHSECTAGGADVRHCPEIVDRIDTDSQSFFVLLDDAHDYPRSHPKTPVSSPSSSMSMSRAAGLDGRPGIVIIEPQIATTKPAPALRRNSLIGRLNPLGAPI